VAGVRLWTDEHGINVSWNRRTQKQPVSLLTQFLRCACLLTAAIALSAGSLNVAEGHWPFAAAGILGALPALVYFTAMRPRPIPRRPDYALIASMEREVYGEAFRHDGAPAAEVSRLKRCSLGHITDVNEAGFAYCRPCAEGLLGPIPPGVSMADVMEGMEQLTGSPGRAYLELGPPPKRGHCRCERRPYPRRGYCEQHGIVWR
jgi:hypothetical protein